VRVELPWTPAAASTLRSAVAFLAAEASLPSPASARSCSSLVSMRVTETGRACALSGRASTRAWPRRHDHRVVAPASVAADPSSPEVEAGAVDLGRRAEPELEVECRLAHVEGRVAGRQRAACARRPLENAQRAAHGATSLGGTPLTRCSRQARFIARTVEATDRQRTDAAAANTRCEPRASRCSAGGVRPGVVGGHDHRRGPLLARQPRARGVGHDTVPVVVDVLAEVPDRAVVGLRIEVQSDLLDAPVEVGEVLRDERPDALARAPLDDPRVGEKRRLGPKRLAVDRAVQDDGCE